MSEYRRDELISLRKGCESACHVIIDKRTGVLTEHLDWRRKRLVQVFVRDNNVDQALRALKKKLQREGVFREMKLRKHYEKPSERKVREKAEAVRRARKLARKKLQREGLLPPTKPRVERTAGGWAGPSRVPRFGS
jgi:small subunit ribosomal protein S21